jgi:hypothetical protein
VTPPPARPPSAGPIALSSVPSRQGAGSPTTSSTGPGWPGSAYRARQRTSTGQHHRRQDRRSEGYEQRHQRAGSQRPGAGQHQRQRQDQHNGQREQRRPPPHSANGRRSGATSGDDLARIRRIIAALLRKAAATSYPHEAAACREKAEALRVKYGL